MKAYVLKTNTDLFLRRTPGGDILVSDLNKATTFSHPQLLPGFHRVGGHRIQDMQFLVVEEIRTVRIVSDQRIETLLDQLP